MGLSSLSSLSALSSVMGGGGGSPAYDAAAQSYFDVRDTYGPLTVQQKIDISNRFAAGKANGYWDKLNLYLPMAGGDNASANLINAINPAQILTPHGGITYANSITGDGATGYVDSGISGNEKNFIAANLTGTAPTTTLKRVMGAGYTSRGTHYSFSLDYYQYLGSATALVSRQNNVAVPIAATTVSNPASYNIAATLISGILTAYMDSTAPASSSPANIFSSMVGWNYYLLGNSSGYLGSLFAENLSPHTLKSAAIGSNFTTDDATNYLDDEAVFQAAKALLGG